MTRTFITSIPFQPEGKLDRIIYKSTGNNRLAYPNTTRFPIVPVINGYADAGDRIRVVAVLTDGENFRHNYEAYFVEEIQSIVETKGLFFDGIEIISSADSEDIDTQLKLFLDLTTAIHDGDQVSDCITYGTKPTPLVQTLALNYAYRLKKNVMIGCVAYGRFDHASKQGLIYDTTALFYMASIVNKLAEMKAPNPEKAIRALLALGDDTEDHNE
jgi:hypothetical protein